MADTATMEPSTSQLFRPDQLPDILTHPDVQALPFGEREKVLEHGVGEASDWVMQNGGWDAETYRGFGDAVGKLRKQMADTESVGEKAMSLARTGGEMTTSFLHSVNAVAQDAVPKTADGQWRVPFSEAAPMVMRGLNKVGPAGAVLADALSGGKEGKALESDLESLHKDLDEGNFKFDPDGITDFVKQWQGKLAPRREAYFNAVDPTLVDRAGTGKAGASMISPDVPEASVFAESNGLHAPRNAALVAEYLRTRSPQAWKALRDNLIEVPTHATADAAQQKIVENSDTAKRINQEASERWGRKEETLGQESMTAAGDPVNALSMVAPYLAMEAEAGTTASRLLKSTAHAQAWGALGLAVQRPGASADDYWENAKHMFAGALGMQVAGLAMRGAKGKGEEVTAPTEPVVRNERTTEPTSETKPVTEQPTTPATEGATDADFSAAAESPGVLPQIAANAGKFAESTPVVAEPAPLPEPAPVKYRTFDQHGRLKESKEAPHAEATKELRGRESMLQKILDCLAKKLAA